MITKSGYPAETQNLGRLFARVRRRALGAAVIAMLLFAIAAVVIVNLKPRYQAEAMLQLGERNTRLLDANAAVAPRLDDTEAVLSEVQVLQSADMLSQVVRRLGLQNTEEFGDEGPGLLKPWLDRAIAYVEDLTGLTLPRGEAGPSDPVATATIALQRNIWVDAANRSRVIRVVATSRDPARAAAIANALVETYMQRSARLKEDTAARTLGVLRDRIALLQRQIEDSDRKSEAYRQKMQLFRAQAPGGGGNTDISLASQQLQVLTTNLSAATALREEAEAKVRAANAGKAPDVVGNRLIQELQDQETTLRARQADLASNHLANHPSMLAVNAQLREVRGKLSYETGRVLQSLRSELDVARARERTLADQVARVKVDVARYEEAALPLRAAEQQAETSRKLLADLTRRQQEIEALRGAQEADAQIVSTARPPLLPFFPRTHSLMMIAALGSIGAGVGISLAREMRNKGIWSGDEVRDVFGVNCLGLVPLVRTGRRFSPADYVVHKPNSAFAEAIRTVSVWLDVLHGSGTGRSVLVTSAVPGEGKTSLSMALARQIAHAGEKVVVVDLDFRRPRTHSIGGVELTPGVAGVLGGQARLDEALRQDQLSPAWLLPAGATSNPLALLRGPALKELIATLRLRFDLVLLDSPPTSVVADTRMVARAADAVVFVTRWGSTGRDLVAAELRSLEESGAQVIGVTLNHVNTREHARYGYSDSGIYLGAAKKYYIN
ncbi:Polysaccharide biosynthesis tyrosine autokinase [Rhodovastum atsumiense]|uniref:non-specific protein-tyrosine kinase n=1 Tax=Rhodovastum atsumiense TaxID=504468 RepID=A0A5M6IU46_9PROT|nr:polysaccharide biosynthesis tyrosine autokinase [Rhodovastum atsumiense]KAA5610955.1 polysaccharide biosynthesis tyrosine autokinase [Rhodovastum atsumiense]CAH2601468.1 Polysaccharide biosynthesis tyrosine autokinase [Rhodovastum atsumiense]